MFGFFGGAEDTLAGLGLSDEAPAVAPAGIYQVLLRVSYARGRFVSAAFRNTPPSFYT